MNPQTALGFIGHQPIVKDSTHSTFVPLDFAGGRVLLREEDDRPYSCQAGSGAIPEINACAGCEHRRIGKRLPTLNAQSLPTLH